MRVYICFFITEQNERGSEGNETNVEKIVYTDRHDRRNTMEKDCPVYDSDVDRKYCAAIIQYGG